MKTLIALFLFSPIMALAQTAGSESCRFSKKANEHNSIVTRGCSVTLCSHVVICGKIAKSITCKAPAGTCDGYDANECVAKATTVEAEFDTVDRRTKDAGKK